MPVQTSYPGVYIEEIPSGVHTITGVATSIAAFVGGAEQGPVNRPGHLYSFADFQRLYGGLDAKHLLGYSVKHFFDNGGSEAYVVRMLAPDSTKHGAPGTATPGGVVVNANGPGVWSRFYGVTIKQRSDNLQQFTLGVVQFLPDATGKPDATNAVTVETYDNLSMDPADPRYVLDVVNGASQLILIATVHPTSPPTSTARAAPLANGADQERFDYQDAAYATAARNATVVLDQIDLFNLLCVPGLSDPSTITVLQTYCKKRRAFFLVDYGQDDQPTNFTNGQNVNLIGADSSCAAFYFPWISAPDPLSQNRASDFPPCGFVAGVYASTDAARGVWKAPAGTAAPLTGVLKPMVSMNDEVNGGLNLHAINCIRSFSDYGTVVWGARTMDGDDERGSDWKYVPVRRTALYIEESLYRGTRWVVFEPNAEPLWSQIRLQVGAFMHDLFRKGAFQGATPTTAYFVKCDSETTSQNEINYGVVNILVGFAPLKPSEFVVIQIQQTAGDVQT